MIENKIINPVNSLTSTIGIIHNCNIYVHLMEHMG